MTSDILIENLNYFIFSDINSIYCDDNSFKFVKYENDGFEGLYLIQNNNFVPFLEASYDYINLDNFYNNFIEVGYRGGKGIIAFNIDNGSIIKKSIMMFDDLFFAYDDGSSKYFKIRRDNNYGILEVKKIIKRVDNVIRSESLLNEILDCKYKDLMIINDNTDLIKKKTLSIMVN